MKKQQVRCQMCGTVHSVRKTPHFCSCSKPPTRCTPVSAERFSERVLGIKRSTDEVSS